MQYIAPEVSLCSSINLLKNLSLYLVIFWVHFVMKLKALAVAKGLVNGKHDPPQYPCEVVDRFHSLGNDVRDS